MFQIRSYKNERKYHGMLQTKLDSEEAKIFLLRISIYFCRVRYITKY